MQADQRKARPEFRQREAWEKVLQGFCFALGLIFIILAPILLFSGINPIMVKNPIKQGMLTIDLELISTGNSYRIFETKASRIEPLTKTDDNSWRLYFEPTNRQIDYVDMQKLQFNTYSDNQWTISPPSLRTFIMDFRQSTRDLANDTDVINFKAHWTFTRDNPTGKENTQGYRTIKVSKKAFMPVVQMLEKDSMLKTTSRSQRLAQVSSSDSIPDSLFAQMNEEPDLEFAPLSAEQPVVIPGDYMPAPAPFNYDMNMMQQEDQVPYLPVEAPCNYPQADLEGLPIAQPFPDLSQYQLVQTGGTSPHIAWPLNQIPAESAGADEDS